MTGERFDYFVNELPDQINDWFFENKLSEVEQAVNQLFVGLPKNDSFTRKKVITVSQTIMERLTLAYQNDFAKILIDPLLSEFTRETDPQIVVAAVNRASVIQPEPTNPTAVEVTTNIVCGFFATARLQPIPHHVVRQYKLRC